MEPYGSYNLSTNYQQNQSMAPYQVNHNNGHNMQQFLNNGMNNYYNSTPTTSQFPNNNGFLMSANAPSASPSTNTLNASLSNNGYISQSIQPAPQPTSSHSYYNVISPNPNAYFNNAPAIYTHVTNVNIEMSSNTTLCYQGENFTHNMPLQVNPSNINYGGSTASGSNSQHVSNSKKDDEWFNLTNKFLNNPGENPNFNISFNKQHASNSKIDDEWFNLTSKFLNDREKNVTRNISLVSNTHQTDSKQNNFFKNQSNNTKNPKTFTKILPKATKISEKLSIEQILANEQKKHYYSFESELYYKKLIGSKVFIANDITLEVCHEFETVLGKRATAVNALKPVYTKPRKMNVNVCKHKCVGNKDYDNDSCSSSDEDSDHKNATLIELAKKCAHPDRLHPELWHNELGEMNDGPVCKCSCKSQRSGIHHNIYIGEGQFKPCLPNTNNADKLYHYRISITPSTNFLLKCPTVIKHERNKYIFEGFSLLSHYPIPTLPTCKVVRFNTNYAILYIEEKMPENFVIQELELFYKFFFKDILELVDLDFHAIGNKDGCPVFHFMPRFVRDLSNNNNELLSMRNVLKYLLNNNKLLFEENSLPGLKQMSIDEWQDIVDEYKGMIITNPETKPSSIRVDQLDRNNKMETTDKLYPVVVHFGIRPSQLSYAGNPDYQKRWRDYVKFRHLLANMPKPSAEDKRKLKTKEISLQETKSHNKMKRGVTAAISSKGFYKTGLMCDIVQHAMLLPVLVCHFRFHKSLECLENSIGYKFKNKYLLQLALTHPSYRDNFGTNPDHVRNTLTNCGIRQPEYGGRHLNFTNTRKRGLNTLINIMSQFGKKSEMESNIMHNERLEFLGDAVIEFLSTIHLFNIFPDVEEGSLATYRAAIVQNQHLAIMAKYLKLDDFMLYAHGSDLCHDSELKHAMANCFEALMGALFLDGGVEVADRVFGETFFKDSPEHLKIWVNYPKHLLQQQEPDGDRKWIKTLPLLQRLTSFEDSIGIKFNHIRLLARAFTDRSVGFTNLTLGSNQRLEFLGDTVLQLIASDYLYKYFPEHHEGHLSLLRSSLVNNRTQSVVCDDLGMVNYALYANPKPEMKTKDRADLLEALLGALYIDKGLKHCQAFCNVCFFPRLHDFILKQDWNDPKSKLQQCCLTLRSVDGGEPDIPIYKVIECMGPTNGRKYTVAVYFKGVRLSQANGHSIQRAEMNAANSALEVSKDLFPQLDHQRKAISRSLLHQSTDSNTNFMDIIKMLESNSSKNDSDLSESEKKRKKLHKKLLAVLCSCQDYNEDTDGEEDKKQNKEEELDEPVRKKIKRRHSKRKT
ncbi:Double-stranded RNA-binding domain,Ribonuclease III domain,Ribonuclease III [Cinara cedri]|uniref:Ribonuclease 3 n=1 Tax=Cinara cedri TaxID=506608 RepID=A0A5E4MDD5_9HEMI|nr:Double-stranded RNA-binding domain,Ribonuclease III domain,Ribonuclease III [Cinara cedri]